MHLLLDTHIFLWYVNGDKHLPKACQDMIANAKDVYVSSASIWEINLKIKLKKLHANVDQLVAAIAESGFTELPIKIEHAQALPTLLDIHKDPFDRILIAQAICEPLTFITADRLLEGYSDLVKVI